MKTTFTVLVTCLAAQCAITHCRAQPALVADPAFKVTFLPYRPCCFDLVAAPGHKWIVRGHYFDTGNDVERTIVARLNPDGSLDTTFTPGSEFHSRDWTLTLFGPWRVQDDGKILFCADAGEVRVPEGIPLNQALLRLNTDGSLDTTFAPPSDVLLGIHGTSLLIEPNGCILAGSLRLNPTGGVEGTLSGTPLMVNPDGTMMARTDEGLGRLKPDGTKDPTFATAVSCPLYNPSSSQRLALDSNGRLLVGAQDGGLYRLNSTGAIDAMLRPAEEGSFEVKVDQLAVRSDQSIVIVEHFRPSEGGLVASRIVLLDPAGKVQFVLPLDPVALEGLCKLVVEGRSWHVLHAPRQPEAQPLVLRRLVPAPVLRALTIEQDGTRTLQLGGEVGWRYQVEASGDCKTWTLLDEVTGDSVLTSYSDARAPSAGEVWPQRFYRCLARPDAGEGALHTREIR